MFFDLRPNYGGGNEDNAEVFQKVPCTHCCIQCPWLCSRPPTTHASARDSWTLTGSLSLGVLVHTRFCLYPPRVCFPVLCKFCWLYGGVNGDLLQEGLCHTQVCFTQNPWLCGRPLLTCTSTRNTGTQFWLSLCGGLWVLVCTAFVWALWVSLTGRVFDSKCDFAPPTILLGLLLCPWMWVFYFGGIQHSPVDGCSAEMCNFGVEDKCTSFYSTILDFCNFVTMLLSRTINFWQNVVHS